MLFEPIEKKRCNVKVKLNKSEHAVHSIGQKKKRNTIHEATAES